MTSMTVSREGLVQQKAGSPGTLAMVPVLLSEQRHHQVHNDRPNTPKTTWLISE